MALLSLRYRNSTFNPFNAETTFVYGTKNSKYLENHLNPVMLVFIGKLLLSTFR